MSDQKAAAARAAEQFNRQENRSDGPQVVASLSVGLDQLRDLLYVRIHHDVEAMVGRDSLFLPVSELKAEQSTKLEIELYQIAESAAAAAEQNYLAIRDDWYLVWLARLRLGAAGADPDRLDRIRQYLAMGPEARRLAFSDVLARTLAEAGRAPLVLLRLVPLCVRIVTALAFGDSQTAARLRGEQREYLPAIGDCPACSGGLLEIGQQCPQCGNPLWKSQWLTSAD